VTAAAAITPTRSAITSIRSVPELVRASFSVFGTFGTLLVTDRSAMAVARGMLDRELRAIDLACSRFRPDSELTMLNQASGRRLAVSPLLAEALAVALRAAAATDGDVDPTCGQSLVKLGYDRDFTELASRRRALAPPSWPVPAGAWQRVDLDQEALTVQVPAHVQIDLGATAKALAADRAARAIAAATGAGTLVNLGGDIAVAGPPPASGWRIQIVTDEDGTARRPVIAISGGGLATSSTGSRTWRRGRKTMHHIVNPRTGRSADSCWVAATVAAATCVDANTASTAAIIRSAAAPGWLEVLGLPARLVRADGMVSTVGMWPYEF